MGVIAERETLLAPSVEISPVSFSHFRPSLDKLNSLKEEAIEKASKALPAALFLTSSVVIPGVATYLFTNDVFLSLGAGGATGLTLGGGIGEVIEVAQPLE